jgi:1,4-dihydroxy-2-naphthoyl-CoA hydrolase
MPPDAGRALPGIVAAVSETWPFPFPPPSGFERLIGLEIVEATGDRVVGTLDVDDRHKQPYGIVHGGVYCSIVETLGSIGAAVWGLERGIQAVVGVSNTTDFLRSVREGAVTGVATPVHRGRSQQLWQVEVTRSSDGKPVARGQVRLHNLTDAESIGGVGG